MKKDNKKVLWQVYVIKNSKGQYLRHFDNGSARGLYRFSDRKDRPIPTAGLNELSWARWEVARHKDAHIEIENYMGNNIYVPTNERVL